MSPVLYDSFSLEVFHSMVIHYNTDFKFFTLSYSQKYAPSKVSNFWGAYQFVILIFCFIENQSVIPNQPSYFSTILVMSVSASFLGMLILGEMVRVSVPTIIRV